MHAKRAPADRQATARELRITLADDGRLFDEWAKQIEPNYPDLAGLLRFRATELRTILDRGEIGQADPVFMVFFIVIALVILGGYMMIAFSK